MSRFEVYDNLKSAAPNNLLKFMEFKYRNRELADWNVGIITKQKGISHTINDLVEVKLIDRTESENSTDEVYYIRKSHIISPEHEFIDLSETEMESSWRATRKIWSDKGKTGEPSRLSGEWVRNNIRKPSRVLLLLYFLNPEKVENVSTSDPITGFAISFPGTNRDDAVSYAVHEQLLPFFDQDDYLDELEDDEN